MKAKEKQSPPQTGLSDSKIYNSPYNFSQKGYKPSKKGKHNGLLVHKALRYDA